MKLVSKEEMKQGRYYIIYQPPEEKSCINEKVLIFVECRMKLGSILWVKKTIYRCDDFQVEEYDLGRNEGICPDDIILELTTQEYLLHLASEQI